MLRVLGECGDGNTRIENRVGEPAANPYLYMASHFHAGLDGMARELQAPQATDDPYGGGAPSLPTSLGEALAALQDDAVLVAAFGPAFVDNLGQIKQSQLRRFEEAVDKDLFQRTEYFGRI